MARKTNIAKQDFDYFLVLDFEATCDNTKVLKPQVISYRSIHDMVCFSVSMYLYIIIYNMDIKVFILPYRPCVFNNTYIFIHVSINDTCSYHCMTSVLILI